MDGWEGLGIETGCDGMGWDEMRMRLGLGGQREKTAPGAGNSKSEFKGVEVVEDHSSNRSTENQLNAQSTTATTHQQQLSLTCSEHRGDCRNPEPTLSYVNNAPQEGSIEREKEREKGAHT